MTPNLSEWCDSKPYDIEERVRTILRYLGEKDLSRERCQAWVRVFISSQLPRWRPGLPLTAAEAQQVGAGFERYCARAEGRDDDVRVSEPVLQRKRKSKR